MSEHDERGEQYESMTPVEVEARLRRAITDMVHAEKRLRQARDAETQAELAYRRARWEALLHPDCPRASRDGVTVAVRDAWVEQRCHEAYQAYRVAETTRKAAEDHLRTVRDVASTLQTIAGMVRASMALAGVAA